jgi:hypothetical protein
VPRQDNQDIMLEGLHQAILDFPRLKEDLQELQHLAEHYFQLPGHAGTGTIEEISMYVGAYLGLARSIQTQPERTARTVQGLKRLAKPEAMRRLREHAAVRS